MEKTFHFLYNKAFRYFSALSYFLHRKSQNCAKIHRLKAASITLFDFLLFSLYNSKCGKNTTYSPSPLSLFFASIISFYHFLQKNKSTFHRFTFAGIFFTDILKSWEWDSNPRPADYESAALPTEPSQHALYKNHALLLYIILLKNARLFVSLWDFCFSDLNKICYRLRQKCRLI